jgi:hypothetical protein
MKINRSSVIPLVLVCASIGAMENVSSKENIFEQANTDINNLCARSLFKAAQPKSDSHEEAKDAISHLDKNKNQPGIQAAIKAAGGYDALLRNLSNEALKEKNPVFAALLAEHASQQGLNGANYTEKLKEILILQGSDLIARLPQVQGELISDVAPVFAVTLPNSKSPFKDVFNNVC